MNVTVTDIVTATKTVANTDLVNFESMTDILPKAGYGWLGVFVVTAVIVAVVYLLNKLTSRGE